MCLIITEFSYFRANIDLNDPSDSFDDAHLFL